MKLLAATCLTAAILGLPALAADKHVKTVAHGTVLTPPAQRADARKVADRPSRGLTMAEVIDIYGQPAKRHDTVGDPPITRWDYPNFSVFFEYNIVLDSVVPGHPPPLYHKDELAGGG